MMVHTWLWPGGATESVDSVRLPVHSTVAFPCAEDATTHVVLKEPLVVFSADRPALQESYSASIGSGPARLTSPRGTDPGAPPRFRVHVWLRVYQDQPNVYGHADTAACNVAYVGTCLVGNDLGPLTVNQTCTPYAPKPQGSTEAPAGQGPVGGEEARVPTEPGLGCHHVGPREVIPDEQ